MTKDKNTKKIAAGAIVVAAVTGLGVVLWRHFRPTETNEEDEDNHDDTQTTPDIAVDLTWD